MTVPAPLALFGDLGFQELLLVAVVSVMIFGKRLPEVAGQAFAHFQRARRTLSQMWRETGIDDELRRIQRDLERKVPRERHLSASPRKPPPKAVARKPEEPAESAPTEPPERRHWRPKSEPAPHGMGSPTPTTEPIDQPAPSPDPEAGAEAGHDAEPEAGADAEPEAGERAASSSSGEARREP